ncbi:MAG: 1-(5-phosphoribosyl)-5-[Clostridia bacterium]|nr:1-(5-phosphoribosyl)-5-[(5-phosphoribosylamino)methylideneamino]imidazole-4-carboxamide isomerase [Clostridia bacterium]
MKIFPAIDIFDGKAVRLLRGDYNQMTVYDNDPVNIVKKFQASGAKNLHLVDLEGAKSGDTPNMDTIKRIIDNCNMFVELGGGLRCIDTVEKYLSIGVNRVILGTAAVTDPKFLKKCIDKYGDKIAVGIDIKDGYVAIKGWTENSAYTAEEFFEKMQSIGVQYVICTDISKDGAMNGIDDGMYDALNKKYSINITASGGVTSIEDIKNLAAHNLYGAIIGKAYYTGAIDIADAVTVGGEQ